MDERVFPTPDLDDLPALWREAEEKYPPTKGWGMKLWRRWLSAPHDGAVWSLTFSRTDESVSADDVSPTEAFRTLLDPDRETKRADAARRHVEELVADAQANLNSRLAQLESLK